MCPARPAAVIRTATGRTFVAIAPHSQPLARGWSGWWDDGSWHVTPILSRTTTEP